MKIQDKLSANFSDLIMKGCWESANRGGEVSFKEN